MSPESHATHRRWPALRGGLIALLGAALFGLSTPLVQRWGAGLGSFTTAALLYAGATLLGIALRQPLEREARVQRGDGVLLGWMALFGAVIGPVALAWGLQHTSGASASLMLALEALFTALLARWWRHEAMDRRVAAAMGLLTVGSMALVADRASAGTGLGLLAVMLATAAWGVDNTLSRGLSARDPGQVVAWKGALGALATALISRLLGEPLPSLTAALALLAVGASGYGLSLRCYLLAQRAFGASRTASVFAFAPFIGAVFAVLLGERIGGPWSALGAVLMLAGVLLHLAERHTHEHAHDPIEHEHAHVHVGAGSDGHHDHPHGGEAEPAPGVAHSHPHRHTAVTHTHGHVPDDHHAHRH